MRSTALSKQNLERESKKSWSEVARVKEAATVQEVRKHTIYSALLHYGAVLAPAQTLHRNQYFIEKLVRLRRFVTINRDRYITDNA